MKSGIGENIKIRSRRLGWDLRCFTRLERNSQIETVYENLDDDGPAVSGTVYRCPTSAFIEPTGGFIISGGRCLIDSSKDAPRMGVHHAWYHGIPSPFQFARSLGAHQKNVLHYPKAVSMRHLWEHNYFHFTRDVLAKLPLLDAAGIDSSIPLILGGQTEGMPFVRQLIGRGALRERNWVFSGEKTIQADTMYFSRVRSQVKVPFSRLASQLAAPPPDVQSDLRLYVIRTGRRRVANQSAVDAVLTRYGFSTVDVSTLSIGDQIDLFSRTRYLLIVHGAAMINVIYRAGAPMTVLELDGGWNSGDLPLICAELGFEYFNQRGVPEKGDPEVADFKIDVSQLDENIRTCVARHFL